MKTSKFFMLGFVILLALTLLVLQQPDVALSESPLGIKPTEEPALPPGTRPTDRQVYDVILPETGQEAFPLSEDTDVTSYAPDVVHDAGLITVPVKDTSPVMRVIIPDLEVDAAVKTASFEGKAWNIDGLGADVAWLEKTSLPGLGSNTVLAGHFNLKGSLNGPFRYLLYLKDGAEIQVLTQNYLYRYAIDYQMRVSPENERVVQATEKPKLTLLTCSAWDQLTKTFKYRRVVVASLMEVLPLPVK